ncbi:Transposase from transposon Tn916 [Aliarcobacter thereius]|uniref:tyrosine-type recombinase/integrase n=1 Tax=Aliarcobacter thereius TaxID=544718 RepID=UPI00082934DB|nr:site-specific integrase [Aliarcobacter thereius]OCL86864.1 Transposase from transposon Tn916 [Aliarcobacter thereius]
MSNIIKFKYDDIKITIRTRYNNYYLDFIHDGKRIKRSTGLSANENNLKDLKINVIPEIIKALTGSNEIEYLKEDIAFVDFSRTYFSLYEHTVRPHVFKRNYLHFNNHIEPYFRKFNIIDIKPLNLEYWQNKLLLKYAPSTVSKYRSILYSMLEKAFLNDIIEFNPFSKVKSPLAIKQSFKKLNIEDDNINPFNEIEIKKILLEAKGNLYYLISIMLFSGIRPGEVIALTWDDIDFRLKRIAVDKTIVNGKIGNVKTQSSVRYVDIVPSLEIILKDLKNISNSDYLLCNQSNERFFSHDILALRFRKLLSIIGIKERKLYNLRHTFASIMISKGYNLLWVSKMLGHKDLSITLKFYARFIKEDDEKRIDKLSKIVPLSVPFFN